MEIGTIFIILGGIIMLVGLIFIIVNFLKFIFGLMTRKQKSKGVVPIVEETPLLRDIKEIKEGIKSILDRTEDP